LLNVKFLNSSR